MTSSAMMWLVVVVFIVVFIIHILLLLQPPATPSISSSSNHCIIARILHELFVLEEEELGVLPVDDATGCFACGWSLLDWCWLIDML